MKKSVVVVDIDGVLFETPVDAVKAYNQTHGANYDASDIFNFNAEHDKSKFIVNGEDQFHKFQHATEQYRQVSGVKKALERLSKRARIVALTSRNYDMFHESTKRVIEEQFGDLISEVYFTTQPSSDMHREKGEIAKELGGKVLVDDAVKYCESAAKHGLAAVLIPQPYNKTGHNYSIEWRADDWEHAVNLIEKELDRLESNS